MKVGPRDPVLKQHASRRGLTLLEVIVVIAIIGIVVFSWFFSTLRKGRRQAYRVQCAGNMKQLYSMAMIYSDKVGGGFFPIAPGKDPRSHESLQLLANFMQDVDSRLFTCPDGEAVQASSSFPPREYVLGEANVDFAWIASPVSNKATDAAICSDKYVDGHRDAKGVRHRGHRKNLNVLRSDGSVSNISETDPLVGVDKLPWGLTR